MSIFSNLIKGRNPSSKKKKADAAPDQTDPFQEQRSQLSRSIIPGKTRLGAMAAESAGGVQPLTASGAFQGGSQTPTFRAEDEEVKTGRRFNRSVADGFSRNRIQNRMGGF